MSEFFIQYIEFICFGSWGLARFFFIITIFPSCSFIFERILRVSDWPITTIWSLINYYCLRSHPIIRACHFFSCCCCCYIWSKSSFFWLIERGLVNVNQNNNKLSSQSTRLNGGGEWNWETRICTFLSTLSKLK